MINFRTPCTCFPRHTSNVTPVSSPHISSWHIVGLPLNSPAKCYLVTSVRVMLVRFYSAGTRNISCTKSTFLCFCTAPGVTRCFSKYIKIFPKSEIPPLPPLPKCTVHSYRPLSYHLSAEFHKQTIMQTKKQAYKPVATWTSPHMYFWFQTFAVFWICSFLLGYSPPSEFYMPSFRNTLSVPSS